MTECNQEIFPYARSQFFVFKNMKKWWFSYTEKSISMTISSRVGRNNATLCRYISCIFQAAYHDVVQFKLKALHVWTNPNNESTVKPATGKIQTRQTALYEGDMIHLSGSRVNKRPSIVFSEELSFLINSHFNLNFTFLRINVGASPQVCKKMNISIETINGSEIATFCGGRHTKLSIFVSQKMILLKSNNIGCGFLSYELFYSVIDDKQIGQHSKGTDPQYTESIFHLAYHFLQDNIIVHSFLIQTKKYNYLSVEIYMNAFAIFDGPGTKAYALDLETKNIVNTTSFQCLVVAPVQNSHITLKNLIKFQSVKQLEIKTFFLKGDSLSEMTINTGKRPRIVWVKSLPPHQVNMTIKGFVASSSDCKYNGIFVYEDKDQTHFKLLWFLCDLVFHFKNLKNVYSTKFALLIVVYWYAQYSKLNVTLSFSNTICTPVYINACEYLRTCTPKVHGEEGFNKFNCRRLLDGFSSSGVVTFEASSPSWYDFDAVLSFSIGKEKCAVLQIFQDRNAGNDTYYMNECTITLKHSDILATNSFLHHHITTYLQRETYAQRSFSCPEEFIKIYTRRQLCEFYWSKCHIIDGDTSSTTWVYATNFSKVVYGKIASPFTAEDFSIELKMYDLEMNSWMEWVATHEHRVNSTHFSFLDFYKKPVLRGLLKWNWCTDLSDLALLLETNLKRKTKMVTDFSAASQKTVYDQFSSHSRPNLLTLRWRQFVVIRKQVSWKWFAWSGQIKHLRLRIVESKGSGSMTIYCTPHIFKMTLPLSFERGQKETGLNDTQIHEAFEYQFHGKTYFLLKTSSHFTWKEAAHKCQNLGSFLPIFLTKQDEFQFVAMVQRAQSVGFVEAVYLGIKTFFAWNKVVPLFLLLFIFCRIIIQE